MNYFDMKLLAKSKNEAFARNVVASFAIECSPTLEEINDIKTAVSEAVTNVVVQELQKRLQQKQKSCLRVLLERRETMVNLYQEL